MKRSLDVIIIRIAFFSIIVCFVLTGLLMYFLLPHKHTDTQCLVVQHGVIIQSPCDPINDCFQGSVSVNYTDIHEMQYTVEVIVLEDKSSEEEVKQILNKEYPIGNQIPCFYFTRKPNNIQLGTYTARNVIALIVFLSMSGVSCFLWIFVETIKWCCKKYPPQHLH